MRSVTIRGNTFYNGDCISGARQHLLNGSVDLIICDPPYGIRGTTLHKHYNRDETFVVTGYVEVSPEDYGDFSRSWISEVERVLRPGGSVYIVSGYTNLYHILHALRQTDLREVNHLIWKYPFGVFTTRKYISSHYHILFYEKPGAKRTFHPEARFGFTERDRGNRSINAKDREDVWIISREYKAGRIKNKNELPAELVKKMIQYSSSEGDLVCDFFLGGFSTARAAIGLDRRVTGFEISKSIFDMKVREMENIKPGGLLARIHRAPSGPPLHAGSRWSTEDLRGLAEGYYALTSRGVLKKEILAILCERYGRGRWAIEKALKRAGVSR